MHRSVMLTAAAAALVAMATTAEAQADRTIELVDLSSPRTRWRLTNDPVMGGLSTSKITPNHAKNEVNFAGHVRIVPKLHAPGFCDAEAESGLLSKFPDASSYDGIELVLKATDPLRSFKQSWGAHGKGNFGSYKAGFVLSDSEDWQQVFIPWDQYTNKW